MDILIFLKYIAVANICQLLPEMIYFMLHWPTQKPAQKPAQKPVQKPAQKPAYKPDQEPAQTVTDAWIHIGLTARIHVG